MVLLTTLNSKIDSNNKELNANSKELNTKFDGLSKQFFEVKTVGFTLFVLLVFMKLPLTDNHCDWDIF